MTLPKLEEENSVSVENAAPEGTVMKHWIEEIKEALPEEFAKDVRLNLDAIYNRTTLSKELVEGCMLACAVTISNPRLSDFITTRVTISDKEFNAATTAATLMAQNNIWYPYVEMVNDPNLKGIGAGLRMNAISTHGGTSKAKFEAYSLAASIIGRCHLCVKAHYDALKKEGFTVEQLRDIGRIASVMNAIAKAIG
jgi:alkyl hydroperoxide reductase subunit D